jgi:hypothetical protein
MFFFIVFGLDNLNYRNQTQRSFEVDWDSVVGIATHVVLNSPGIEFLWG